MKLENERYKVTFCEKGGEIESFTDKETGIQYMWQGDQEYWGGKNPTLFPIVGNTFHGTYEIHGKEYAMKNHGLIRYATLTCIKQDGNEVVFQLRADETTLKQYPFQFLYEIAYTLEGNKLTIHYTITNEDHEDMPFTFGLHPGFNCPLTSDETFEDYHLHFSNPEQLQQIIADKNKQHPPRLETSDTLIQDVPLSYQWIEDYATIIYKNVKSPFITMQGKEHGVRVSCLGFPYLAIWTVKTGAPYLCIEPWMALGDSYDTGKDFYHRDDTMMLSPKKSYTSSYTIEVF